ncbi:major capsid family protein [Campylobacter ureolyticus]|uniref:major capsid family protein n=1 Tax=Campylobacter ureolyticus TaxID=827 RepID=UPI0022B2F61D|nr:major capsid family protein [Campylobacter ureolyticus]MCZ6172434.1 DUF2184 domain-containing protein [Campylobacter ureolyticus]
MPFFKDQEIVNTLIETANTFNEGFATREYPDIQLSKFVPITQRGNENIDALDYGELEGTQDLNNGLIDENTTSLETEDLSITAKKGLYLLWAKAAPYTKQAVLRAKNLGIDLDTEKLANLERVALLTMQKTALIGHPMVNGVDGLLTNKNVATKDLTGGKAIKDMTRAEARDFFLNIIDFGIETNGGLIIPNTIAIDGRDLMTLASKYDNSIGGADNGLNALATIKQAISDTMGTSIEIVGIPLNFAKGIGKGKGNRVAIYTKDENVLSTDWAVAPRAMPPYQRSSVSFEIAVESKFTGCLIRQLDKIAYIDYK